MRLRVLLFGCSWYYSMKARDFYMLTWRESFFLLWEINHLIMLTWKLKCVKFFTPKCHFSSVSRLCYWCGGVCGISGENIMFVWYDIIINYLIRTNFARTNFRAPSTKPQKFGINFCTISREVLAKKLFCTAFFKK